MPLTAIDVVLENLDRAYGKPSWHGPNLRGGLRGVTPEMATKRPAPDRKNIWEHVVHATYWKYVARRRLTGEKRGSFVFLGSNWFDRPRLQTVEFWKRDLSILQDYHEALRETISDLKVDLSKKMPGSKVTYLQLLLGVASHDTYHAGQIQLIRRLVT
jgi:uncharacterized damage-inducible protein DinB